MPNYDYECADCGHQTEIFQKMSDPPERRCPSCGKDTLERLVSRSSFTLKGEGWYADGYGANKKKDSGATESKSDAKSEPKSDAKSETKTAPKSEPTKSAA
jgi:putative FmdB family regulatory protein